MLFDRLIVFGDPLLVRVVHRDFLSKHKQEIGRKWNRCALRPLLRVPLPAQRLRSAVVCLAKAWTAESARRISMNATLDAVKSHASLMPMLPESSLAEQ
jgi:hypothetical protein